LKEVACQLNPFPFTPTDCGQPDFYTKQSDFCHQTRLI
jgi:hypothetical protein